MSNRENPEDININAIVKKLIDGGTKELSYGVINNLRKLFDTDENRDHIINAIVEKFEERQKLINHVADKFLDAFQRKYIKTFDNISMSKFMMMALKYKKKYNLTDEQFDTIKSKFDQRIYEQNPLRNNIFPHTNMSNVFGYPTTIDKYENPFLISNPEDYAYLQEIIKTHTHFINVHQHIMVQTVMYNTDNNLPMEVTNQVYNFDKHNKSIYVHPVIASLFLIKNKEIEERMLYASISHIVNTRYSRQRINTKPDYELLYSMVTDPTDLVCDNTSCLKDLKNRVDVQIQLWNNVYNLRSGRCYDALSLDFLAYIDKCKVTNIDNPDVLFLSDEGIILRRLFSIFSFRPIYIQTYPILNTFTSNPLNLQANYVENSRVPFLVYQIPLVNSLNPISKRINESNIDNYSKQLHMFYQEGLLVPKQTRIIDTMGPLIFYIPRKYKRVNSISEYMYLENNLQASNIVKFNINNNDVKFNYQYSITDNTQNQYSLKSLVYYNVLNNNIYLGHKTLCFINQPNNIAVIEEIYKYQPLDAIQNNNKPIVPFLLGSSIDDEDRFIEVMSSEIEPNYSVYSYVTILIYLKE